MCSCNSRAAQGCDVSVRLFADDTLFLQRFLKSCGFPINGVDGAPSGDTDDALADFEGQTELIAAELGVFDKISERNIRTLHPRAQRAAREFLTRLHDAGFTTRIISGTRTYAEQDALFRKGRFGNPPPRVTNARGGQSNHNFGIAWDIGIFKNGAYVPSSPLYDEVAAVGKVPGIEWGGDWTSFADPPHYQLATGSQLSILRQSFEAGAVYL